MRAMFLEVKCSIVKSYVLFYTALIKFSYTPIPSLKINGDNYLSLNRLFLKVNGFMEMKLYPYVIFLPRERKQNVLKAIFGSTVPIDILKFSVGQGISKKIYQRDLIEKLEYSNKTVIEHLKELTRLGILRENMEKVESGGRTLWLKNFVLSDLGRWFALLILEEEKLSREEKIEIVCNAFRSYMRWIKELSEKLNMNQEILQEIFSEETK